jgi:hypothetical protein
LVYEELNVFARKSDQSQKRCKGGKMTFRLVGEGGSAVENEDGVQISYQGGGWYRYVTADRRKLLLRSQKIPNDPDFTKAIHLISPLYWLRQENLGPIQGSELERVKQDLVVALTVLGDSVLIVDRYE